MKRVLFVLGVLIFLQSPSHAQTVQGTIVDPSPGGNKVAVYAKVSSPGLNNTLFLNINITISIPDQTASGGNPTDAQITAVSKISNLNIIPALTTSPPYAANPYVSGGRAYYSYIMNDNGGTTVTNWPANSSNNPVAEFTFPSNSYFSGVQLNDLTSGDPSSGGPNNQMYWYVNVIGAGDVTNYANMFYGSLASPPTNNNGSPSFVGIQPLSVLPVNFLGFNVSKVKNSAVLSWSVESEDANTKSYEVLKSLNGIDFTTMATIPALNNGRSNNSYTYTQDNLSAISASGVIYFRIKQVDKDGRPVLTEIKSVRLDTKGIALEVYPNPIKSVANLTFDLLQTGKVSISLTDATGKLVKNMQIQGFKGANIKAINLSNLSSGNYMLKLQTAGDVSTMPLVKVN